MLDSDVGSLIYAMIGSRSDLGYAIGLISRFMSTPGRKYWEAVNWDLKGTLKTRLTFTK